MMSMITIVIAVCSIVGPMGLTLAVTSKYKTTRVGFAMLACVCAGLMGVLFGYFFGDTVMREIVMYLMTPQMESGF